jgi:hypothetical protein
MTSRSPRPARVRGGIPTLARLLSGGAGVLAALLPGCAGNASPPVAAPPSGQQAVPAATDAGVSDASPTVLMPPGGPGKVGTQPPARGTTDPACPAGGVVLAASPPDAGTRRLHRTPDAGAPDSGPPDIDGGLAVVGVEPRARVKGGAAGDQALSTRLPDAGVADAGRRVVPLPGGPGIVGTQPARGRGVR